MENSLTQGAVWKKLLLFMIPIAAANLLQAMYGTVDLMIVGLFSSAADVSAVSTGSMTLQTITGIVSGLK
jgi:Na+-driven multidrug efflux pump